MTDQDQREAVVAAARSWIGTPYHSGAKIKGVGVDCAQILAMVYPEAGVRAPIEVGKYSAQWHLHSTIPLYEEAIVANGGKRVPAPTGIGDLVLYFQGKQFAHGAIITRVSPLRFVHAFAPARRVVEGDETEFGVLISEDKKFFTLW
jgi:cell wall-associated NlpC family hydrolase